MRFMARLNAPTYPDADQSAPTTPMTSPIPALEELARPLMASFTCCLKVGSVMNGDKMSMILATVSSVCPTSPTSESRAIRAGKIASTE